jgi:hypothetical protein
VNLADWSGWREVDPHVGGMFALRRFLHAYGPSTVPEFSRWFALEPALSRRLFEALGDELAEVDVEGSRRWTLRSDLDSFAQSGAGSVQLLPHFDAFVVGSHPRERLMDASSPVARISPGTAAGFAVVLVGGRVEGVWERRPKGKRLLVRVDLHRPVSRRQRGLIEDQAERVSRILERDCELEFGDVALRAHA